MWDERSNRLYWVAIEGRPFNALDPSSGANEAKDMPVRIGSFARTADEGVFLAATEAEMSWLDWPTGELRRWVEVEEPATGNRLNDGRTDRSGRFWVGSMYEDTSVGNKTGFLHRIDPDGSVTTVRDSVGVANGSAFSPDGSTMYWADSPSGTVWAYDYDAATGGRSGERVFLDFEHIPGKPDGACVDVDGCYWIACVHGSEVRRYTPQGELDVVVALPIAKPTMPAFGGPDLRTLFITSIADGSAGSGGVYAIETGHQGIAETHFAGAPS